MTSAVSPDPHRAFPAPAAQCWRSPRPHSGRLLRADRGQVKVLSARQQKGKRQHAVQCISMRADNALNTARATADALSPTLHQHEHRSRLRERPGMFGPDQLARNPLEHDRSPAWTGAGGLIV